MIMCKKYFVDSENVGDSWISLLRQIAIDDEILVFYTSRSPRIGYESAILLRESDKKISFVKCNEGNNALDFQLGTYLGYELHKAEAGDEFIIVSNDTGFDAVVKFWKDNPVLVTRITGKDCQNEQNKTNIPLTPEEIFSLLRPNATDLADTADPLGIDTDSALVPPHFSQEDVEKLLMEAEACRILYIFGTSDLSILHTALVNILGEETGKKYYRLFKRKDLLDYWMSKYKELSWEEKQESYCSMVFERCEIDITMPSDFSECVMKSWSRKKNLNSLRDSIQEHYGKEIGLRYYTIIKPHMKMLDKIK